MTQSADLALNSKCYQRSKPKVITTMGIVLDTLREKHLLVSDGIYGTILHSIGLKGGDCAEEWNISHPDEVRSIAAAFLQAGSDIVTTNTFGGSALTLKRTGYQDKVAEFNESGVRHSLEAAPGVIVAASVGPTGEFIEPIGNVTYEQMDEVFSEQIASMLHAGAMAICVETMTSIEEATCAIRAAKKLDASVDVLATMTFDTTPKGYRTLMGVDPSRAAEALVEAGADVIGSNCGQGIDQMISVAAELRKYTDKPIAIQPNAGIPALVQGKVVFPSSPEYMASRVRDIVDAGANIIGGCCGVTPKHIKKMKAVVDELRN